MQVNELELLLDAIRSSEYADDLLDETAVPTETGVRLGNIEAVPGLDKPVLRDATTKRKVRGSGQYPRNKAVVAIQESLPVATEYRETVEYRQAFEKLFPAGGDITDRGSLAYAFDQFWQACEGSPQVVDCEHPEVHRAEHTPARHVVAFKKDAGALFKMIELGVGKAAQTQNVNVREEKLVKILEQRVVDVRVHGISQTDVNERMEILEAYGYSTADRPIESEFVGATAVTSNPGDTGGNADTTGGAGDAG